MTITTAGIWIDLPTSGGASDRLALDEPGGAGLFQIAASNACLAARENGLRPIWEDFGASEVYLDTFITGEVGTFQWGAEDTDGGYVRLAGTHRVRLHGETADAPRLHLAARGLSVAPYTLGLVLAISAPGEAPSMRAGTYATTTTTATSLTDLAVTLALTPDLLVPESLSLQSGGGAVDEAGLHTVVSVWVGAWCTSGSGASKGAVYGASVLLREP